MGTKDRSPDNTATTISMSKGLLADIDARAADLGMNRSQYLCQLAVKDLAVGGDFLVKESSVVPPALNPGKVVTYRKASKKDTQHKIQGIVEKQADEVRKPRPPKK